MAETLIQGIRDFQDVIRLLEEHPEWQADLRRLLLTNDLLTLPEQMVRLTEDVRELATAQARTEQRLGTLMEQVAGLTEQVAGLTKQVAGLTEQVANLTKTTLGLSDDVAKLKGMGLETRLRLSGSPFFGVMLRKPQVLSRDEVTDLLDDAEDRGTLTPTEMREVQLADVIVRGVRRNDRTPVYLVVEVSWAVDTNDVRRAADRASFLAKTGTVAMPVVVGEKIGTRAAELAQTLQVWQMTDEEVIPPAA
jgi:hypothetical protein